MKSASVYALWVQVIAFVVATVVILWIARQVGMAGGGLDSRFASIQISRLIALLAPYLILPISIALAFALNRKRRYGLAMWLPLALVAFALAGGQAYLRVVPDPVQDNFGERAAPYLGFLVLPNEAVPDGFEEVKRRYTKREYIVGFAKTVDGQTVDLRITEGDHIAFGLSGSELVKEFEHRGIAGQVYVHRHARTKVTSFRLIWLAPQSRGFRST